MILNNSRLLFRAMWFMSPLLLASCATIHGERQDLKIIGPTDLHVETMRGEELHTLSTTDGLTVFPDPAITDSIRIDYRNHSVTLVLAKNPSVDALIDCLPFGAALFIDDLDRKWFSYAPVYVTYDSSSNNSNSLLASSKNWIGDEGTRSIHALFLGGIGFAGLLSNGSGLPVPLSVNHISTIALNFQAGIGIDYRKQLELFYLFRDEPSYPLSSNDKTTATITAGELCLRYFFRGPFFIQGSYGKGLLSSLNSDGDELSTTSSFSEAGAAIGWAGDISYIALQYNASLSTFNVPIFYEGERYHTIYLNFGLNFQL